MTAQELNRDQLIQLKARLYEDQHPEGVSYGELADVDDLISDAEAFDYFAGVVFVPEDFF